MNEGAAPFNPEDILRPNAPPKQNGAPSPSIDVRALGAMAAQFLQQLAGVMQSYGVGWNSDIIVAVPGKDGNPEPHKTTPAQIVTNQTIAVDRMNQYLRARLEIDGVEFDDQGNITSLPVCDCDDEDPEECTRCDGDCECHDDFKKKHRGKKSRGR